MFSFAPNAESVVIPGLDEVAGDPGLRASSYTTSEELQRQGLALKVGAVGPRVGAVQGAQYDAPLISGENPGDLMLPLRIWADVTRTEFSDDFVTTSFKADSTLLLLGVDTLVLDDQLLLGAAIGYDRSNVATNFNAGSMELETFVGSIYAGYLLTDELSIDAQIG